MTRKIELTDAGIHHINLPAAGFIDYPDSKTKRLAHFTAARHNDEGFASGLARGSVGGPLYSYTRRHIATDRSEAWRVSLHPNGHFIDSEPKGFSFRLLLALLSHERPYEPIQKGSLLSSG